MVFFATSWLYADGIAVIEVDRVTGEIDRRVFRQRIADARIALLDQAMEARLARATLVISGIVTKVERLGKEEQPEPGDVETEWRDATVLVNTVEKGKLRGSAKIHVNGARGGRSHKAQQLYYPNTFRLCGQEIRPGGHHSP